MKKDLPDPQSPNTPIDSGGSIWRLMASWAKAVT